MHKSETIAYVNEVEVAMTQSTLDILTHRFDRLEQENRWWRRVGSISLLGLITLLLMGQVTTPRVQKVIEAERFVLRDVSGKLRSLLAIGPGDSPLLAFLDANGEVRTQFGLMPDGNPSLTLLHTNGRPLAVLIASPDGEPGLVLLDPSGAPRMGLRVGSNGSPHLALIDKDRQERMRLFTLSNGSPEMLLTDKDGKVIWKAP
jgi:hypothetical protein